MCAESRDHGPTPKDVLSSVAAAIQFAKDYLNKAVEATHGYDPEAVKQIGVDLSPLDAFLTQVRQARDMTDEGIPAGMAERLRLQVITLQAVSDDIKRIASDVATPPGVGGYMEQSVTSIAQAMAFIRELP